MLKLTTMRRAPDGVLLFMWPHGLAQVSGRLRPYVTRSVWSCLDVFENRFNVSQYCRLRDLS